MFLGVRGNWFQIKDMCIEFVINISRKDNNVKIKFNLETKLHRLQY